MKITDVQIDGFGVWSDLQLDQFADGCTVFFGQNEAGKTTLMEFLRSVLYGFSPERRTRYLPPVHGGRAGGGLGVVGAGGRFTVRRTPGNNSSGEDLGKVEVLSPTGTRQGAHVLGTLLSGIDEPIFNNVFAVGLRELQELSTLNDTEAAEQLYKLSSGLDRVSLIDVMRDLAAARNQLLAAAGSKSELLDLLARRDKVRAEIKELTASGHRWAQLAAQRLELQEEVTRLEENIQRMEREARAVAVALQVRDDWLRRVDLAEQLQRLGPPVALPERAVERLDELNTGLAKHREQVEQIRRQRRVIVEEAAAQPLNRQILSRACRIEAVCEHAPWIQSLEGQIQRLHEEIDELQADLRARWEKLGLSPDEMPEFTPDLSARAVTALRGPARAVRDATNRLQDAKAEQEQAHHEAEDLKEQLATQLANTGRTELNEALEEAGQRVGMYRRRLQLAERLEGMELRQQEMAQERHELLEDQVLPVPTLVWCGLPFVAGIVIVLSSLYWDWGASLGWTVTIMGLVCSGIAVAVKVFLEQAVTDDLDACLRQVDKLNEQVRQLHQEREELDSQLPEGGGPLDARLRAAEEYVKQLEELTPLETKRQAALQRAEAVKDKAAKATETAREAREQWRETLRTVGLPLALTPDHLQHLAEGNDHLLELARRVQTRREELQRRQAELTALTGRVNTLFTEAQLVAAGDDPRTRLRQLAAAMSEQRRWIERRREMRQEHRQLKQAFREHARECRKLLTLRRVLFHQAHVVAEQQLRKLAARQAKIEQLTQQHEELATRIRLTVGTQCTDADLAEVLESHRNDNLEQYEERLLARLHDAQERLTQLHQSRGEMIQEMKMLAENRRLPAAKLELGCLEEQIGRAAERWRVLAVAGLMLEDIRQIYETERQPETLAEASTYLVRLTEGRYRRIWTPLSQDGLRLDMADGETLPLDVLSQGTREALFLSLRLALASAYARRGALLPLVLDDVLVNLDRRRAKAAVDVLCDFAHGGHQLLVFTCHHHIVKLFQQAGAEVRILPARAGQEPLELWDDEPAPAEDIAVAEEPYVVAPPVPAPPPPVDVPAPAAETPPAEEPVPPPEPVAEEPPPPVEEEPEEEPAEEYDHSIWDDRSELELATEGDGEHDPLEPAHVGAGRRALVADWWWEHEVEEPAA